MDAIPPTIKPEFDQADYDELRKHYFERVVQHNVELPGGRVLRKQTSPPRIEQDSRGFRELRKTIKGLEKDKDHNQIYSLLRELRTWEERPPTLGGALPSFMRGDSTEEVTEAIDLTVEVYTIDVDTYIIDTLLVGVMTPKPDPDGGMRMVPVSEPAPFAVADVAVKPEPVEADAAALAPREAVRRESGDAPRPTTKRPRNDAGYDDRSLGGTTTDDYGLTVQQPVSRKKRTRGVKRSVRVCPYSEITFDVRDGNSDESYETMKAYASKGRGQPECGKRIEFKVPRNWFNIKSDAEGDQAGDNAPGIYTDFGFKMKSDKDLLALGLRPEYPPAEHGYDNCDGDVFCYRDSLKVMEEWESEGNVGPCESLWSSCCGYTPRVLVELRRSPRKKNGLQLKIVSASIKLEDEEYCYERCGLVLV